MHFLIAAHRRWKRFIVRLLFHPGKLWMKCYLWKYFSQYYNNSPAYMSFMRDDISNDVQLNISSNTNMRLLNWMWILYLIICLYAHHRFRMRAKKQKMPKDMEKYQVKSNVIKENCITEWNHKTEKKKYADEWWKKQKMSGFDADYDDACGTAQAYPRKHEQK